MFASQADFEAWLEENHADSDGIWVKMAKRGSGIASVSLPEALDTALCFGWIDGQRKGLDDDWFLQRYTPRRRRSKWSKINREKAEALIAARRMRPAGLAQVEAAKADGRWEDAYPSPSQMTVPPDLQAEFDRYPKAAAFFETLSSTNRYAVLYRIHDAKRPETRARRIAKYVGRLARGEAIR